MSNGRHEGLNNKIRTMFNRAYGFHSAEDLIVEPVSLTVGAVVAALVTKAAEKGGENLADAARAAVVRLVGWLRERFTREGDMAGAQALVNAEEVPDSPSRVEALAAAVDRRADSDPEFRREVQQLVETAKQQGLQVESIVQTVWGNQNVQNAGVQDSTIHVSYGQPAGPPPPAQR